MRRRTLIVLLVTSTLSIGQNGIFVDHPKAYDDWYLQLQLNALRDRLAGLRGFDQASIISHLGAIQGADIRQSGLAIQAGYGPPLPAAAAPTPTPTPPPAGTPTPSAADPTTNPPAAATAAAPSLPMAPAPTLTPPSAFNTSALDTLNEQMQLNYEITNLQLLLNGALNDRYVLRTQSPKKRVTVGFPITISAIESKAHEYSVAEVDITISNPPGVLSNASAEPPSIITLLPREKTYNVASIVDKSVSVGGGIVTGVMSAGVSWLWGHKTYYLVQEQDTVALQQSADPGSVHFKWQFRPVLNQRFVRPGMRQTFVQFSVPDPGFKSCSARIRIRTGWRRIIDKKRGILAESVEWTTPADDYVPYYDTKPYSNTVEVHDIGGGLVSVLVTGSMLPETRVRIGARLLDSTTPGFRQFERQIEFIAAARELLMNGASLVARGGEENIIQNGEQAPNVPKCGADEDQAGHAPSERPPTQAASVAGAVLIRPLSDSLALVTIPIRGQSFAPDMTSPNNMDPVIVSIGDRIFGLRDAPFRSHTDAEISLIAPVEVLKANQQLIVQKLLQGKSASFRFVDAVFPRTLFAVSKVTLISTPAEPPKGSANQQKPSPRRANLMAQTQAQPPLSAPKFAVFGISGSDLTGTSLLVPPESENAHLEIKTPTLGFLYLSDNLLKTQKQVVLQNGSNSPATLSLPDAKPETLKAELKKPDAIAPGTRAVTISGSHLELVGGVAFNRKRLNFRIDAKGESITIDLPPELTQTEGVRYLEIGLTDGSKPARVELTVQKKTP